MPAFLCMWPCRLYCFLYWSFLGVSGFALEAAVNVNVTSQLLDYSYENNKQRQTLEIVAATLWFLLLILDLSDVIRYGPFILIITRHTHSA